MSKPKTFKIDQIVVSAGKGTMAHSSFVAMKRLAMKHDCEVVLIHNDERYVATPDDGVTKDTSDG